MLTYLNHFFAGEVEPLWPHVILLAVTVAASVAVGAGIIFEGPKYSESVHRLAVKLVIAGVVIEAFCTITLFVFDERISAAQQEKIIALEHRLAARALSDDQSAMIVSRISKAAPQDVGQIGYVFSATNDEEFALAIDLSDNVFSKLGWTWKNWPTQPGTIEITTHLPGRDKKLGLVPLSGVQVQAFDSKLETVVATLVAALRDAGIEFVRTDPKADAELQKTNPQMTIMVMVGMKPALRIPAK
jgi:hypothetical protein